MTLLTLLLCLPGAFLLKQDYSYRDWFNEKDPVLITQDKFEKEFGSLDTFSILIVFQDSIFKPKNMEILLRLTEQLEQLPYTARVDSVYNQSIIYATGDEVFIEDLASLPNLTTIKNKAMSETTLKQNFIFDNQKSTLITYRFNRDKAVPNFFPIILAQVDNVFKAQTGMTSYHLLGNPKIANAFRESAIDDLSLLLPILLSLIAILIFIQFRSIMLVFINYLSIIISIFIMLGIMSYLGISFNNLTSIAPELILAIGLADAIHILATYSLVRTTKSHFDSMSFTLNKNFLPTIITSLTTACGFLAFTSSETNYIVDLGIVAALGTLVAWFSTYFFLSPLILISQPNLNIQKRSFNGEKFIDILLRYKKIIYLGYSIFFLYAFSLIPQLEINSDPIKYFRGDLDFTKDIRIAEIKMKGIFPLEVVVQSSRPGGIKNPQFLREVDEFREWIVSQKYIHQEISALTTIKKMHQVFNQDNPEYHSLPEDPALIAQLLFTYNLSVPAGRNLNDRISTDQTKLRLTFMTEHLDSKNGNQFYQHIEEQAKQRGLEITITGKRYLWHSLNQKVVFSFVKSLFFALILVSIILSLVLKSVKLGLLSLIPNIIPIVSGSLFLSLLSRPLDIGSSIVASIVLGIAVDDTIHVMTNYQRYLTQSQNPKNALIRLFSETAPALVITTSILCLSFACFLLASFIPNQNIGILLCLSLLLALICDLTLLPLILHDFVRKDSV